MLIIICMARQKSLLLLHYYHGQPPCPGAGRGNSLQAADTCTVHCIDTINTVTCIMFWNRYATCTIEKRPTSGLSQFFNTCAHGILCQLHVNCTNPDTQHATNITLLNAEKNKLFAKRTFGDEIKRADARNYARAAQEQFIILISSLFLFELRVFFVCFCYCSFCGFFTSIVPPIVNFSLSRKPPDICVGLLLSPPFASLLLFC